VGTDETIKIKKKDETGKKHVVQTTQKEYFQTVTADIVHRLEKADLKTDLYYSVQHDEIYCRIAATEVTLRATLHGNWCLTMSRCVMWL
jgi:hypothetical protein